MAKYKYNEIIRISCTRNVLNISLYSHFNPEKYKIVSRIATVRSGHLCKFNLNSLHNLDSKIQETNRLNHLTVAKIENFISHPFSKLTMSQLETITATLADGFKQLEPDTFQTSAELTTARRTKEELRNRWFFTANFTLYDVEDDDAVLYFGGREANPILNNIDDACNELINKRNYRVPEEDKQAVIKSVESGQTLRVKLSDLNLKGNEQEFRYVEIDTKKYDDLNDAQRAFAEKVYDGGDNFVQNMKMLRYERVRKTRIYVLSSDYVKEKVTSGNPVARAGWLYNVNGNSCFVAYDRLVNGYDSLRGVLLKKVAKGDAPQNSGVLEISSTPQEITTAQCYERLLSHPGQAIKEMDDRVAAGLSKIVADYLATKVQ
jgi:hypothetical protein